MGTASAGSVCTRASNEFTTGTGASGGHSTLPTLWSGRARAVSGRSGRDGVRAQREAHPMPSASTSPSITSTVSPARAMGMAWPARSSRCTTHSSPAGKISSCRARRRPRERGGGGARGFASRHPCACARSLSLARPHLVPAHHEAGLDLAADAHGARGRPEHVGDHAPQRLGRGAGCGLQLVCVLSDGRGGGGRAAMATTTTVAAVTGRAVTGTTVVAAASRRLRRGRRVRAMHPERCLDRRDACMRARGATNRWR